MPEPWFSDSELEEISFVKERLVRNGRYGDTGWGVTDEARVWSSATRRG